MPEPEQIDQTMPPTGPLEKSHELASCATASSTAPPSMSASIQSVARAGEATVASSASTTSTTPATASSVLCQQ